jgi:hypothetical protein
MNSVGIDVELRRDVIDVLGELLEGLVAVHLDQRRVGRDIFALHRGLEDSFQRVLENALVLVFGQTQGLIGLLPFLNFVLKNVMEAGRPHREIGLRRGIWPRRLDFIGRGGHRPTWDESLYHARQSCLSLCPRFQS